MSTLVEGDDAIAPGQQHVPQHTPLDDVHIDAVGQHHRRPAACGDHPQTGAVGTLDVARLPPGLSAEEVVGIGVRGRRDLPGLASGGGDGERADSHGGRAGDDSCSHVSDGATRAPCA